MSASQTAPLIIHGWTVFVHPLFIAQLEAPNHKLKAPKQKYPFGYVKKNASRRLAALARLAFDVIPQDPTRPEYRQGDTLGDNHNHRHWFRAKFYKPGNPDANRPIRNTALLVPDAQNELLSLLEYMLKICWT